MAKAIEPPLTEGKATFTVAGAFYRPQSAIARDLAILAAAHYRQGRGQLRVLDAMTGCGVRPLRYVLEAGADWVWANEGNPDMGTVLSQNLAALPPATYGITHQDANQVFFHCYQTRDFYDLVDIDNFGGPAPYTHNALWATRLGGLLYLTSTDGRSTSGHDVQRSLRTYGAAARSHPAAHEQGLRLLIGHGAQAAAARGLGIEPVFSLFTGQVHRAMVRLVSQPTLTEQTYGFLAYCHRCGHYQTVGWRQLGRVDCPACHAREDRAAVVLSGPLWLGPLHDQQTLRAMATLAHTWDWFPQAKLLQAMDQEADMPPYYYPLGDMGRRGKMDIPNRDQLMAALQGEGYRATLTPWDWQAIKTNAPFEDCLRLARSLSHPKAAP